MSTEPTAESNTLEEKDLSLIQDEGNNGPMQTVSAFLGMALGLSLIGATVDIVGGMGGGLDMSAMTPDQSFTQQANFSLAPDALNVISAPGMDAPKAPGMSI